MTTTMEFEAFLSDLGARRDRLLHLAGAPPTTESSTWAEDLRDIAGQLQAADEEMRVQQEELLEVEIRLQASVSENDAYFQHSSRPRVVSDLRGRVLRTNSAADQLLRRLPGQPSRPMASWFQVSDRGRIRDLVGRMQQCAHQLRSGSAVLEACLVVPGGARRTVIVAVVIGKNAYSGVSELRWELRTPPPKTRTPHEPQLHLVPSKPDRAEDAPPAPTPLTTPLTLLREASSSTAVEDLTAMAVRLATSTDAGEVLRGLLAAVFSVLPETEKAAVTLHRRIPGTVAAWSDEAAEACEQIQLPLSGRVAAGPAVQAHAEHRLVSAAFPEMRAQWPLLAEVASEHGIRSVLAVPIALGGNTLGTLSLYSGRPDAFSPHALSLAPLLAVHAATALIRLEREKNLQVAIVSRQTIGEAVGILVERHRILPQEAFDRLVLASQRTNAKVRDLAEALVRTGQDPEDFSGK